MSKKIEKILISGGSDSYKILALDNQNKIDDVIFGGDTLKSIKSNIYLGKIEKIEPSLQAAFVNYGANRSAFLPFSDVHSIYYNNTKSIAEIIDYFSQTRVSDEATEIQEIAEIGDVESTSVEIDDSALTDIEDVSFEVNTTDSVTEASEKKQSNKRERIQDVLKPGQLVLVQVFKDERGNKCASVTTYITLQTKYFIFSVNNSKLSGISKRIINTEDKNRLRKYMKSISVLSDAGLVVRTAAANASQKMLDNDYNNIALAMWSNIAEKAKNGVIGLIKKAESNIITTVRDKIDDGIEIVVDEKDIFQLLSDNLDSIGIKKTDLSMYESNKVSLFEKFKVKEFLASLYRDRVNLPSGGYIIINYTEALVSIDVNSGKLVNEKSIEHTAIKTNLEAVNVIVEQIRLRDIGGLIIIDFIDMENIDNRRKLEFAMKDCISAQDKARVHFTSISPFGLMEISRQRLRTGFIDSSTRKCIHCYGTGRVLRPEFVLNELRQYIYTFNKNHKGVSSVLVKVSNEVDTMYKYYNAKEINEIADNYNIKLSIVADSVIKPDCFLVYNAETNAELFRFTHIGDEEVQKTLNIGARTSAKEPESKKSILSSLVDKFFKPKKKTYTKKYTKNNTERRGGGKEYNGSRKKYQSRKYSK